LRTCRAAQSCAAPNRPGGVYVIRKTSWRIAVSILALCAASALPVARAEESLQPDTRLPEAVKRGDTAEVQSLLRAHVSANSAEGDGSSALHWAVYENNLEIARMLLEAHADVNAGTRLEAFTPLYMAGQNGNAPMIELLLKYGAKANEANGSRCWSIMARTSMLTRLCAIRRL
jgi:ankyrin repeat protein